MRKPTSILLLITVLSLTCCTDMSIECDVKALILDANDFPEGVYLEQLYSPSKSGAGNSASRSFSFATDLLLQEIISTKNPNHAKDIFIEESESVFDEDNFRGPWKTPPQVNFQSIIANNYRVACGMSGVYQCRMIATYDNYFVFFRSYISEEGIDLPIYNELLRKIDVRMNRCVSKK